MASKLSRVKSGLTFISKNRQAEKPLKYVAPTDLSFGEEEISLNIALV